MEQFLAYSIVGLSTAAIYAIVGSGLVLTYTTTGVFNFAHGAAGMLAAFCYWQLTQGWGWPVIPSLAVVLLVLAPLFGWFLERIVIRPVQELGDAERLVVTVAMLSGLIAVAQWIWDPNSPRTLPQFFASAATVKIGPVAVTWQQLITMIVAIAAAAILRFGLYRTRIGTQMRATVDDKALAGLTGANPGAANRYAWIFATQLAAIGGILVASQLPLDAAALSLLIVSAYTAAVFGRLRSLPMTFVGAVVLGLAQSYLTGYLPSNTYLQGLQVAAPALLLFIALLVFPHRSLRGRGVRRRPVPAPTMRGTAVFGAAIIAFGVILATSLAAQDLVIYGAIFSLGIVALSYVPLTGYAGQISLCQLSIAAIGALTWAHLAPDGQWWAIIAAVVVSAVAGAVIAIPALRLSGIYLALGTTAFAVILDQWVFTIPRIDIGPVHIPLFDSGEVTVAGPKAFGLSLGSERDLMILAAVFLALASLGVAAIRRGRFGRRLIALRDSEAAYAMLGGNLLVTKVTVFALSAGLAGLGGAFYAMQQQSIAAGQFSYAAGLPLFLVAVVGGLASVGAGLWTGTALIGPINALIAVAPGLQNFTAILPALTGLGFARSPTGVVPLFREQWLPLARRGVGQGGVRGRVPLIGLLAVIAALWALRLAGIVNGWILFWGVLVLAHVALYWAKRHASPTSAAPATPSREPDIPVEWLGIRRPWQADDEEVLDRAVARG